MTDMALPNATITYNLADMVGADFDVSQARVWVTTNVPGGAIADTVGNAVRLGDGLGTLAEDGTGTLSVWTPGTGSNPASWQTYIHVSYAPRLDGWRPIQRTFGPFTITGDANLADLVAEQEVPPTYLSGVLSELQGYVGDAEAAAARAEDISNISTSDGVVAALVADGASSTAGALADAFAPDAHDVGFDVIAYLGQSNAVSYGTGVDLTLFDVPSERVKQWPGSGVYMGKTISAVDPLYHHEVSANTVGSGPAFAKKYIGTVKPNRSVLLVPCAHGGTGFSTSSLGSPPAGYTTASGGGWDPSGAQGGVNLYEYAKTQIASALAANPNSRIVAVVWHQGEADASLTGSQYAAKLDALIDGIRAMPQVPDDVPFIVGQMIPERAASTSQTRATNTAHIETQARKTRTGFFYGPAGLNLGDNLHYSADGQREIGNNRILPALLRARANVLGVTPLAPSSVALVQSGTGVTVTIGRPESRFADFTTEYRRNLGAWTPLAASASVDITRSITGLTLGDALEVRVRTVNESGVSAWTTAALSLASLPAQVTGLAAGTPGTTSVPLSWTAIAGVTGYLVEYKLSSSGTWLTGPTTTGTVATVTGLPSAAAHDFRVSATNAAGNGTPSATATATTAAPTAVLTDMGISAWRALSMRKTVSGYAGPAIRVRRSSDNTTLDIGFTAGGDLDVAALLAFVGSGSGYIDTWYDQSGNANHFTQTTQANQPRIVNAGVVESKNGRPMPWFDGTNDAMDSGVVGLYAAGATTALATISVDTDTTLSDSIFTEGHLTTSQNARYGPLTVNTGGILGGNIINDANGFISIASGTGSVLTGTPKQVTMRDTGTTHALWINGTVSKTAAAYTRTGVVTVNTVTVGAVRGRGTAGEAFLKGHVAELLLFTSAITDAARTAGEANQKDYYSAS